MMYQDYLALYPGDAAAHTSIGSLLVSLGYLDQGRNHLAQAISINPRSSKPLHDLAASYALAGDVSMAIKVLDQAAIDIPRQAQEFHAHSAQLRGTNE